MKNILLTDKKFYKSLLVIALPIALQNVVNFAAQMLDTVMVGSLGDTALSAVSLANQPYFLFCVVIFGISGGGAVLISQYWGKGNVEVVKRIMGMAMRVVAVFGLVFTALCYAFPEKILSIFSPDAEVIRIGASYLKIVAFSYFINGLAGCYSSLLRATENVMISTVGGIVAFVANAFFNYCFIFGNFGFPKLGVIGAAIGTVIARGLEFIVVAGYGNLIEKKVKFRIKHIFIHESELLGDFIRQCLPVTGSEFIWCLGALAKTAIAGNLSTAFVAANSVAGVVQQLAMVLMMGVANSATVLIGKAVGEGDRQRVDKMSKTFIVLSLGVGLVALGIIFGVRGPILSLYNLEPDTKLLAHDMMTFLAIAMWPCALEMTGIVGVLRGAGDTRYAFAVDTGCTWLVSVLLGYLAGFVWKLPLLVVYIFMGSDILVRVVLCVTRIAGGKYIKNVTREI